MPSESCFAALLCSRNALPLRVKILAAALQQKRADCSLRLLLLLAVVLVVRVVVARHSCFPGRGFSCVCPIAPVAFDCCSYRVSAPCRGHSVAPGRMRRTRRRILLRLPRLGASLRLQRRGACRSTSSCLPMRAGSCWARVLVRVSQCCKACSNAMFVRSNFRRSWRISSSSFPSTSRRLRGVFRLFLPPCRAAISLPQACVAGFFCCAWTATATSSRAPATFSQRISGPRSFRTSL